MGSLEILGNPTGLLRSIGTGVADLIKLPYSGLTRGPGSFVAGVSKGMGSLLKNVSGGELKTIDNDLLVYIGSRRYNVYCYNIMKHAF